MKTILYWSLAFAITITAAIYQRATGPTYPKRLEAEINDSLYKLSLTRSISLERKPVIRLKINDTTIKAKVWFRRFPTNDKYQFAEFAYRDIPVHSFIMNKIFGVKSMSGFYASVPPQPEAGKLQYYLEISDNSGTKIFFKDEPVVVRFKGGVPALVMIPHILMMFIAMLFSTLAGILAIGKNQLFVKYTNWTLILFTIGGLILGPVVQKYAFGDLWTGIPFGWDLTDNKTLIAFVFWVLAYIMNRKKERPAYTILASIVLLLIYSIPHSMFGSELNYESGQVTQGLILNFFLH